MISEITFPAASSINGKQTGSYYRDSFKVTVTQHNLEAKQVYHSVFGYLPKSVQRALKIRNIAVEKLGFSVSNTEMSLALEEIEAGKQAGFLTFELVTESEVVCGAYEPNMDMWLSVMRLSDNEFALSTLVNLKTRSGKIYMAFVKPFHKFVAKYCLRQALKAGRL
ncbi:DUF2867 domain-containing protein [Vibrio rhodolitus]|uniref:DUF2867 domain-containing protein n=1 Tax=Vibrio rhodolitus TaxID=2231649 RepID=UPI000E0BF655|nr:DUF2867 domain-containing protein [Vibrio rhodolitus]